LILKRDANEVSEYNLPFATSGCDMRSKQTLRFSTQTVDNRLKQERPFVSFFSSKASRVMRLTKLFMLTTALVLALVTLMLVRSVLQDWQTVESANQGVRALELSHLAMKVAEKASAERGPTIPVLNDKTPPDPAIRDRLIKARRATDESFDTAFASMSSSTNRDSRRAEDYLRKAQVDLVHARAEVERVAALPFEERTAPQSRLRRVPIDQMFAVIDVALESVTQLISLAQQTYPDLSQPMEAARLSAVLREYAGRLGSQFTIPLANQTPLDDAERREIPVLLGRINQLNQLIGMQAQVLPETGMSNAVAEMNRRYFAIGLPFIEQVTTRGIEGRPYEMDSPTFVGRYVPEMTSIVQLRDTMLDIARAGAADRANAAKQRLRVNAAIGAAVLLIEIAVFLTLRRRVLRPLLASTRAIVDIADGKLDTSVSFAKRSDEIGDMQNALAKLREISLKKLELEHERERLVADLQRASSVDYVTDALNRRAFTRLAIEQFEAASHRSQSVALIMFDIDHFKAINDRHGHTEGDKVLREIAIAAKRIFGHELFARFGGEEFIAMEVGLARAEAEAKVEQLRAMIEQQEIESANGAVIRATVSIGLGFAAAITDETLDELIYRADESLYQAKGQGRNRVVVYDFGAQARGSAA
jgi:diguanylate cyclase (GGDEF)-like protein